MGSFLALSIAMPGQASSEPVLQQPQARVVEPAEHLAPPSLSSTGIFLVIDLSDRQVRVYEWDQLKATFPVAVGRSGWETPVGKHQIIQMVENPSWQHPFTGEVVGSGADNPLGPRWMGFWTDGKNYVGLHGTPNERSVGTAASHGCIRMYNRDVVKLFEMVQIGTPVTVIP